MGTKIAKAVADFYPSLCRRKPSPRLAFILAISTFLGLITVLSWKKKTENSHGLRPLEPDN